MQSTVLTVAAELNKNMKFDRWPIISSRRTKDKFHQLQDNDKIKVESKHDLEEHRFTVAWVNGMGVQEHLEATEVHGDRTTILRPRYAGTNS
jgi:hypothetical protein